jgi:hypothetical protein
MEKLLMQKLPIFSNFSHENLSKFFPSKLIDFFSKMHNID